MATNKIFMTVILTPKPGCAEELLKISEEGAQHHKDLVPGCLSWQMTKEINFSGTDKGAEKSMILIQEWSSEEEAIDHSKWDYAVESRKKIAELTDKFEFHMSKPMLGFGSK